MNIAELAPLWKRVPPTRYGGSELIASLVTEALIDLKQHVFLFAPKGSKSKGKLVEVLSKPLYEIIEGFQWKDINPNLLIGISKAAEFIKNNNFDIIHNHIGFEALPLLNVLDIPSVTTLHSSLPPDFESLAKTYKKNNFVSISNAQRQNAPYLNYIGTVYHGIDTQKIVPEIKKSGSYFAFLGTISKEKGVDIAIQVSKKTKSKLLIAGEIRSQSFFRHKVSPFLNSTIKFLGELTDKHKNQFLREAKALLFPIRWQEAFGLVMIEAMATGTPVIAFDQGSVSEVVEHDRTGFVVSSLKQFLAAMKKVNDISRAECRKQATLRFDSKIMAKNYLKVFRKVLKKRRGTS